MLVEGRRVLVLQPPLPVQRDAERHHGVVLAVDLRRREQVLGDVAIVLAAVGLYVRQERLCVEDGLEPVLGQAPPVLHLLDHVRRQHPSPGSVAHHVAERAADAPEPDGLTNHHRHGHQRSCDLLLSAGAGREALRRGLELLLAEGECLECRLGHSRHVAVAIAERNRRRAGDERATEELGPQTV
uniref:Uncharacterized protein n=1 Tax=Triticum urartu TaxID=4572 RepID=A0A8R7P591_TRIUA